MNQKEKHRLAGYEYAKRNAPHPARTVTSRRSAKHPTVGKVYKDSRIVEQVHLETVFNPPGWIRRQY